MLENSVSTEALKNELKGNLFEFLVAQNLARQHSLEDGFLKSISPDYFQLLRQYEATLRSIDMELAQQMPTWSVEVADKLMRNSFFRGKIKSLLLTGKAIDLRCSEELKTSDITFSTEEDLERGISLKLSSGGQLAYINTKSGGIKSFLDTYFNVQSIKDRQRNLSFEVTRSFDQMTRELMENLGFYQNVNFKDKWNSLGLSELPGELEEELREIVHRHYGRVLQNLYGHISEVLAENRSVFRDSVYNLVGVPGERLIQVICFYDKELGDKLNSIQVYDKAFWQNEFKEMKIRPPLANKSYFEIQFKTRVLQIRLKPMNKFTVPGLKVNCSIRSFGEKSC